MEHKKFYDYNLNQKAYIINMLEHKSPMDHITHLSIKFIYFYLCSDLILVMCNS